MKFPGLPLKIVAAVAAATVAIALVYTQQQRKSTPTATHPGKRTYESTIGNLTLKTETEWASGGLNAQFTLIERQDNMQNPCELAMSKIRGYIAEAEETVVEIDLTFKDMASYAPKLGDSVVVLSHTTPWVYDVFHGKGSTEGTLKDLRTLLKEIESWAREQKGGRRTGDDVDWICYVNYASGMRLAAGVKMQRAKVRAAENAIRQWHKFKAPLVKEYAAAIPPLTNKYVSGEIPETKYRKALCDLRSKYVPQEKVIDNLVLQRYGDLMETLAQDLWALVDDLRGLSAHITAKKGGNWSAGRSSAVGLVHEEIGKLGTDVKLTKPDYSFWLRLLWYDCELEGVGANYRDDRIITADQWLSPLATLTSAVVKGTETTVEARLVRAVLVPTAERQLPPQPLEGLQDSATFPVSICSFPGGDLRITAQNSRGRQVMFPISLSREGDCSVDLDVDSDNNNGDGPPDRSAAEDALEVDPAAPGKFVYTNVEDLDGDGIPGLADGFAWRPNDDREDVDRSTGFTPLALELSDLIDPKTARIRFTYNASDPQGMAVKTVGKPPVESYVPAGGHLRIWTTPGDIPRSRAPADAGGDYVAPGRVYTMAQLSAKGRTGTLYVEAISPSARRGDQVVSVDVDPDGDGSSGFTLKDDVRVTVIGCPTPTIATPPAAQLRGHDWNLDYEVTADDGLEVRNVMLGMRYMAAEMNAPYFKLTLGGASAAGELKPSGYDNATGLRSRIIFFYADSDLPDRIVVEAKYEVDMIPQKVAERFPNCMTVTQRYEFRRRVRDDTCEPTGWTACARFYPTVRYHFTGEGRFEKVQFPQRFHFKVDAKEVNAASVMQDNEGEEGISPIGVPLPVILRQHNPIAHEAVHTVIQSGRRGGEPYWPGSPEIARWDNYHQTSEAHVEPPSGIPIEPGCPECVHIHWRWGTPTKGLHVTVPGFLPPFTDHNQGKLRIPTGSTQDVAVGIVRYRAREEDPLDIRGIRDWRDLANGEVLAGEIMGKRAPTASIVFWYEGSSTKTGDEFFTHGGFFSHTRGR